MLESWMTFWSLCSVASVGYLRHNFSNPIPELSHLSLWRIPQAKHQPVCIHFHLHLLPFPVEVLFVLISLTYVVYKNNLISENSVANFCVPVCVNKRHLLIIVLCNYPVKNICWYLYFYSFEDYGVWKQMYAHTTLFIYYNFHTYPRFK